MFAIQAIAASETASEFQQLETPASRAEQGKCSARSQRQCCSTKRAARGEQSTQRPKDLGHKQEGAEGPDCVEWKDYETVDDDKFRELISARSELTVEEKSDLEKLAEWGAFDTCLLEV